MLKTDLETSLILSYKELEVLWILGHFHSAFEHRFEDKVILKALNLSLYTYIFICNIFQYKRRHLNFVLNNFNLIFYDFLFLLWFL